MNERTIRELGGEIWAELQERQLKGANPAFAKLEPESVNAFIDLTMGVLARHANAMIRNDPDLPVEPLPE